MEAIGGLARACPGSGPLVVAVYYLRKVSVYPDPPSEDEQVRRSVEGLKDLAMSQSGGRWWPWSRPTPRG